MCGLLPPPVTGNVPRCPGWDREACCGVWRWRWRWRSPLSFSRLPPTTIHASILSFSFFILILLSSILRHPLASLLALSCSLWGSFVHLTSLTIWIRTNERSYLRSVPEEIRVSFIIPYQLLSPLPAKNSQGNYDKEPTLSLLLSFALLFHISLWNSSVLDIILNLKAA